MHVPITFSVIFSRCLLCALVLYGAVSAGRAEPEQKSLGDRMDERIGKFPAAYNGSYVPDFRVAHRLVTFIGPDGPYTQRIEVITDHGQFIALYVPGEKPWFDRDQGTGEQL